MLPKQDILSRGTRTMRSCPSVTDVDPAHSGVKHVNSVVPMYFGSYLFYI